MASSSKNTKDMLVRNTACEAPKFKCHPAIAEKSDPMGTHSMIPPKVLLMHDVRTFYHCPIQDLGTFEMNEAYSTMCENGVLKEEHTHLETKGLTHLGFMPKVFEEKWVRFILSCVHDMEIWLEQPIKITKKMVHRVTGLPMLDRPKATKNIPRNELAQKTRAVWDGRGIKLNAVTDVELKFSIHAIAHKMYSSSWWNSVPCEVVDLAYKIVKNDLVFDLAELQLTQFSKNQESIRASKPNPWKFGPLLVCLFFYVHKFFPSKGTVVWQKDRPIMYQINDFITELGDNFASIVDAYFDEFRAKMENRHRIPQTLVDEFEKEICFLVDCDKTYI